MSFLFVGFGGVVGALLRFSLGQWLNERFSFTFPYPTLLINVSGAFLLGWFTSSLARYFPSLGDAPMLILGVGMCGAYTTFSTFSYETTTLLREHRIAAALLYVGFSLVFGIAAAAIGLFGLP
ncbi:MAG: fluoride efflux transporter CrcB [Alicyclobacillaceae bacterium]|jgi:CrcB protein|nr:fluoride efflux transporter CrcB [Alicyclobacillaceae bacterium]